MWARAAVFAFAVSLGAFRGVALAQDTSPSIDLLDAEGMRVDPAGHGLSVSLSVTNDGTLPADFGWDTRSTDSNDVRVEITDDQARGDEVWATVESLDGGTFTQRSVLRLVLRRSRPGMAFRSRFIRLVGDTVDLHAPSVEAQTLQVALRDHVRLRYESARDTVERTLRVGAAGSAPGPQAARLARLRIHVLRIDADGAAAVGTDNASTLRLLRAQVRAASEIWLQCGVTFGDPLQVPIAVVAPPVPSLVAIADGDGLPARGDGLVRLRADGTPIAPVRMRARATPRETAEDLARALRNAGFAPEVSDNPRARFGADRSADVLVRRHDGSLATLSAHALHRVGTDSRQSVQLATVDLLDGLTEFDNMNAHAGSLEERALIKALSDGDPSTVDLFVVNRFTEATRQGEAFIAAADGSIVNAVIVDRQGLRHLPWAWTLAHELGHVLLDDALHPDNVGPDRPWLLMDADNTRGTVNGPKRLRPADCARAREVAARAKSPLLVPYDVEPIVGGLPGTTTSK